MTLIVVQNGEEHGREIGRLGNDLATAKARAGHR